MASRILFRGKRFNQRTADMIKRAEARYGTGQSQFHIMQGSYNSGVGASAGTHDGGGAADFAAPSNPEPMVRALREAGFAAWYRPALAGVWPRHIHAIAIGDPDLSSGAKDQVNQYYRRQNGLANRGPDNGPRLDPIKTYKPLPLVSRKNVAFQFNRQKPKKSVAVKKVQKVLNRRLGLHMPVDGIAGPVTKAAWTRWEKQIRAVGPNSRPDKNSIDQLFRGYYRTVL